MKMFLKYAGLLVGLQVLFCAVALVLINRSPSLEPIWGNLLVYFYLPVIILVVKFGGYRGESAMIDPLMFGIPSGILLYGVIGGILCSYFKRKKLSA